jgi:DNA-binding IscR family transcriptional regulator
VRELLAVRLAVAVATAYRAGHAPPTAEALTAAVGGIASIVQHTLKALAHQRVLAETGSESEPGYVPARDPSELTVAHVLEALRGEGAPLTLLDGPAASEVRRVLDEAERSSAAVLSRVSLRSLAAAPVAAPADAA